MMFQQRHSGSDVDKHKDLFFLKEKMNGIEQITTADILCKADSGPGPEFLKLYFELQSVTFTLQSMDH